jgi:hypothetical protein
MKKVSVYALVAIVAAIFLNQGTIFPLFMYYAEELLRASPIDEYSIWYFIDTHQNFTNLGYAPLIDFSDQDPEAWQKQLYFEVFKYANAHGKKNNWESASILELASGKGAGIDLIANSKWDFAISSAVGVERCLPGWNYAQKHHSSEKIKFVMTDARDLPLENSTFDVVYSVEANGVLFRKNFEEIHRVLKPNGVFVFTTLKYGMSLLKIHL